MKSISILIFAAFIMLGKFYWSYCYLLPIIWSIEILNNFLCTWKIKFDFFIIGAAYFPTGVQLSLSRCCTKAGVPSHCIGLCNPVRSVARSLGNRINECTEYDEVIEKCWDSYEKIREQRIPELDTNGEQLFQFYRLLYL